MSFFQQQETHNQSPALALDGLYCEEDGFGEDYSCSLDDETSQVYEQIVKKEQNLSSVLLEQDLFWEDNELLSLISKEKETHVVFDSVGSRDGSLMVVRREAVEWFLRVKAHYGFSALTGVLAVNYFDRFISSSRFRRDKPWMGQLAAVACLSLAAKVEETQVPLLLDLQVCAKFAIWVFVKMSSLCLLNQLSIFNFVFSRVINYGVLCFSLFFQVEDAKYVFEAKTIKRMELWVLSTLHWRMNPVTSISFFDHIIRRLGLKTHMHWEFLWRCERLLLSVISGKQLKSLLFLCLSVDSLVSNI
jgi:cyclin D3